MMTRQASVNLSEEWRRCCKNAFGWEDDQNACVNLKTTDAETKESFVALVNLSDKGPEHEHQISRVPDSEEIDHETFWKKTVQEVEDNMNYMIDWLDEKKWIYLLPKTSDEEASLIQSTISSYTVRSANELENLRRHYQTMLEQKKIFRSHQQQQHDMAVIQGLSERLNEYLAQPFAKLQKKRKRTAVQVWQTPLSCQFVPCLKPIDSNDDEMENILGLATTDSGGASEEEHLSKTGQSRKFVPKQPRLVLKHERDFLSSYNQSLLEENLILDPPQTLLSTQRGKRLRASNNPNGQTQTLDAREQLDDMDMDNQKQRQPTSHNKSDKNMKNGFTSQIVDEDDLQREAILLQARHNQHELDAVQTMESTMVQITALLTRFSELVSVQQEEVIHIHDAVTTSKQNVEKGSDQLVDAKDRTEQSKHYMASSITVMAVLLLFFHWIRP